MRINQPVTNVEIQLDEHTLIVSKTDLKGQITFINKDFLDISGFTEAELIGQPHNIVRHPDMPVESFADMWQDLKEGRPWTGLVKNRCKNGDHYWVLATATPMRENGQVVGFMSVRRKPTRQQIDAAESAYRLFREKKAGGLRISHGAVVKGGDGLLANMSLKNTLIGGFAILLSALVLVAGIGIWGMGQNYESTSNLYNYRLKTIQALGTIGKLMADNRSEIILALQHDPSNPNSKLHDHPVDVHLNKIENNIAEVTANWNEYTKGIRSEGHQKNADAYVEARKRYVGEGILVAKKAIAENRFDEVYLLMVKVINPAYAEAAKNAEALFSYNTDRAVQELDASEHRFASIRMWALLIVTLALVAGIVIATRIIRSITRPIDDVIATFESLANGDFTRNVQIARNDEMGKVLQGLQSMQIQQGFNVAEANRVANDNLRIRIALDASSSNLRIADDAGDVIYANKGLLTTLRQIEPGMRERQPNFSADTFIGSNIGAFYADPAAALKTLRELQATRQVEMEIGGRIFNVVTNPIINDRNQRLGTVGEWIDRTAEI